MEKTPLAIIYKQGKAITIECNESEVNSFELLGFLKCYVEALEKKCVIMFEDKNV